MGSKNPGEHQYATDIKWAESNATIIADFYKNMKMKLLQILCV